MNARSDKIVADAAGHMYAGLKQVHRLLNGPILDARNDTDERRRLLLEICVEMEQMARVVRKCLEETP